MKGKNVNLVFVAGFMGSGKSTIAPILANSLGYDAMDIDHEIEQREGKSVSDIFREHGEKHFRQIESFVLQECVRRTRCVISLGGGTITSPENLRLVKSSGILVYLKAEPEEIFKRLHYKMDRPLLRSADGLQLPDDELRRKIQQLLLEREPYYAQADITIMTDDKRIGFTVDEIMRSLQRVPF